MIAVTRHLALRLIVLAAAAQAGQSHAAGADVTELLELQSTARVAASLAEGNHCAGVQLRPRIEATLRYLRQAIQSSGADAGDMGAALLRETIAILDGIAYDQVPCAEPCPAATSATADVVRGDEVYAPATTARYFAALDAVVSDQLMAAERDPPVLGIAIARHSYDPLPHYAPGEAVQYWVHVGAACHGAVLSLEQDIHLPASFESAGSFTPDRDGLWTIYLQRRDGVPLSPLTYLDADTGLPTYFKEFWVSAEPIGAKGPAGVGPWHRRP